MNRLPVFNGGRRRGGSRRWLAILALILCASYVPASAAEPELSSPGRQAVAEIQAEVVKLPGDSEGNPLPLAATWAPLANNFSPDYQLSLIRQGHHLLPCFIFPYADTQWGGENAQLPRYRQMRLDNFNQYFAPALREAARLKLPLSFQRFQFEMELTTDKKYFELPSEENPNVIGLDGKIQKMVDPMGPLEPWRRLGCEQVTSMCWKLAQEIYPDPPIVMLLSNNEHPVLNFHDAEKSRRFVDKYGTGTPVALRQKVFAEEMIRHYRALQQGMCEGLLNETWRKNVRFVAYENFGPSELGRYGGWLGSNTFDVGAGRLTWPHLAWDGSSPSYYTHNWLGVLTDYTSCSMQIEAMNWVFMLKDAFRENPNFWFELSTWDGDTGAFGGKRAQYAGRGQLYDADRYEGMLQFGLWLTRARALRDFRYLESLAYAEPYFLANIHAVDRVYASPVLRKFWHQGVLVPNPERQHPYHTALSDAVKAKERWYLLKTNLEPAGADWGLTTEIPVFALALVMGQAPNREWLLFAHAPRGARPGVRVTLPDYGEVAVDASVTGAFYHVREQNRQATRLIAGGPVSAQPAASSSWAEVGAPVIFTATELFDGGTGPLTLSWDFGDGSLGTGPNVGHAFQKRGLYVVSLKTAGQSGTSSVRYLPISIGLPRLENCLLYLPLDKSPDVGVATERVNGGGYTRESGSLRLVYAANSTQFCGLNSGCDWMDDPARGWVLHLPGRQSYVAVDSFYDVDVNKKIPRYDVLGRDRSTSLWFKATDVQPRQVVYQDGSAKADGMNLYIDQGRLYAGTFASQFKDWPGAWLSTPIVPGKWYHVALVLEAAPKDALGDAFKFYLDGNKVGEGNAPWLRPYWARIGGGWSTRFHDGVLVEKSPSLQGSVDDFAVFFSPLSAAEVQQLMQRQAGR